MPKIAYIERTFSAGSHALIDKANAIITEYQAQGFDLTLRQLYYQFVARGFIANKQTEYKRLGSVINDARLAGLIDWNAIEDRTRNLRAVSHWDTPADIIASAAASFRVDKWAKQDVRPEVWIEKDALTGVIEGVCRELDVPYFSCRGYTSQSEMWSAAMRFRAYAIAGQDSHIFHFGDHDPSGMDMSRDIEDRIRLFLGSRSGQFEFTRLALLNDQIEQYDPPPNPAKLTDSRAEGYIREYGDESWELDALEPSVIADLIRDAIEPLKDPEVWAQTVEEEESDRKRLALASENWPGVADHIEREWGEWSGEQDEE